MDDDEKTKFVNSMIAKYAVLTEQLYENELKIKALEEQSGRKLLILRLRIFVIVILWNIRFILCRLLY